MHAALNQVHLSRLLQMYRSDANQHSHIPQSLPPKVTKRRAAVNMAPQKLLPNRNATEFNQPTRSSRRVRGLAPQSYVSPSKAIFLPPELKVDVLARLDKRDLKSARLVSKKWSLLATGPLFDRVFFSCRGLDLEVWEKVTRHPVIGGVVREVVYDGSIFKAEMEFEEYFWELCTYLPSITNDFMSEPFNSADEEINAFIEDCKVKSDEEIYGRHKGDAFLIKGYKNHLKYAEFERHELRKGTSLSTLCDGLRRLNNLRSVTFSSRVWIYGLNEDKRFGRVRPNTLHGPDSGSPLVRSWNPFHLRPFHWDHYKMGDQRFLICDHFYTLTTAITETHRNISSLKMPCGSMCGSLPPHALTWPRMTEDLHYRTLHAYSRLEVLDISINAGWRNHDSDDLEALATLPIMLQQMIGLKKLKLQLKTEPCYTYKQVFPALALWPKLTQLWITGLMIGSYDLIRLINGRANVTDLTLDSIELVDGTWEGVFEGLCHMRLDDVRLISNFKHRGGQLFAPKDIESPIGFQLSDREFLKAVENYVICGGRHPCQPPESNPKLRIAGIST